MTTEEMSVYTFEVNPQKAGSLQSKADCLPLEPSSSLPPGDDVSTSVSDTKPILSCGTGGGFFLLKVSW